MELVILDIQGIFQLFHPGGLLGDLGAVFLQIFHARQQAVGHIQQRVGHGEAGGGPAGSHRCAAP